MRHLAAAGLVAAGVAPLLVTTPASAQTSGTASTALGCATSTKLDPAPASSPVPGTVITLPQFDPNLGTLTNIHLTFSGTVRYFTTASSGGAGTWSVTREDNTVVAVSGPGFGALPSQGDVPDPPTAIPTFPNIAQWSNYYFKDSGPLNGTTTPSISWNDPYPASATFDMPVANPVPTAFADWVGPTNVGAAGTQIDAVFGTLRSRRTTATATFDTTVWVTPCVRYDYIPAPPTTSTIPVTSQLSVSTTAAPVIPESPLAYALPIAAAGAGLGGVVLLRSRRRPA